MKRSLVPFLILATASILSAGGFGGPPPFTNGSPLPTGVNGAYQANARGNNLTGVIRFAYINGSQSSSAARNNYTIFASGLVFTGPVTASITESSLAGVLDSQTSSFSNTQMTGSFTGRFNTKSPTYFFKGNGIINAFILDPTTSVFNFFFGQNFSFTGVRNSQFP